MAVSRFSTSSVAQGLPKYQKLWDQTSAYFNSDFVSLASATVTSGGQSTITFSSIPQGYKHLQIRGIFNQGGGNWINTTYNGSSTAAYQWHYPTGDGATLTAGWSGGTSQTNTVCAYNSDTTNFAGFVFDIVDYTNTTKYKTGRSICGVDANGSGRVMYLSNLWLNTAAITSITLASSGTFAQYSKFALYGVN